MKGTILGLKNDKSVMWYRFKPEVLSLKLIDEIRYSFDEYKEPKIKYDLGESYIKQRGKSFGFHNQNEIYAIIINENKLINFILIKSHPLFKKVEKLIQNKFSFASKKDN